MTTADTSEARAELSWFFHGGRESADLESNFSVMSSSIESFAHPQPPVEAWTRIVRVGEQPRSYRREVEDWRIERLTRARPIRRALAAIKPEFATALEIATLAPRAGTEAFGSRGPLAPMTSEAIRLHIESRTTKALGLWLVGLAWQSKTDHDAGVSALRIRKACDALFAAALHAFIENYRRRTPRLPSGARIRRGQGGGIALGLDAP